MITIQVIERTQRHVETNEISSYKVFEVDADGVKSYAPITAKFNVDELIALHSAEQLERDDVVTGLRNLANGIEAGNYGDAHNLAWVVDCGNGDVEVGLLGEAKEAGSELFLLLAMGTHKIVSGVTN